MLCTEHKITFVSVSENPGENSVAVLLVVDPVALVRLEQHRVVDREVKDPVAVGRPVLPLPEVLVAVGGRVSSQACKIVREVLLNTYTTRDTKSASSQPDANQCWSNSAQTSGFCDR